MLPSDSDDDVPEGGYYVVEAPPRPQVAAPAPKAPEAESSLSRTASNLGPATSRSRTNVPLHPIVTEQMEASDSDDEAPAGGYQVRTGDPAKARAAYLARAPKQSANGGPRESVIPADRHSSKTTGATLGRRKTVPARVFSASRPKARQVSREV